MSVTYQSILGLWVRIFDRYFIFVKTWWFKIQCLQIYRDRKVFSSRVFEVAFYFWSILMNSCWDFLDWFQLSRCHMLIISCLQIYRDRKVFSSRVFEVASSDLAGMGIVVISYTIKEVSDEVGYLKVGTFSAKASITITAVTTTTSTIKTTTKKITATTA